MSSLSVLPHPGTGTEWFSLGAGDAGDEEVQRKRARVGLGPKSHFKERPLHTRSLWLQASKSGIL